MITTHWVKPPNQATGQDHLATRAVCEHLYGLLLPGITNVTDRARYYSFYPWLLWSLETSGVSLASDVVVDYVRRAECLFALVGIAHGHAAGADGRMHGDRLVGSVTLGPVVEHLRSAGGEVRLSDYAHQDENRANTRYFLNPLGGLGQYYRGSLELLGVLSRDVAKGVKVGYTAERGSYLAEAMDVGVDRSAFFDILRRDRVDWAALDALAEFCPCHLSPGSREHGTLVDLFTQRPGTVFAPDSRGHEERRLSLGLILDLAGRPDSGEPSAARVLDVERFRSGVYSGALPDGSTWSLPPALEAMRLHWAQYQRNELLSLAAQGLFWAALTDSRRQDPLVGASAWGDWMSSRYAATIESREVVYERLSVRS